MDWKTIETIKIVNREGEVENFEIQSDGNYYKLQNAFGNLSFEFDVSSGWELADKLSSIISDDINREITNFLNQKDIEEDMNNVQAKQMNLFDKKKNFKNNINFKTKKSIQKNQGGN